MHVKAHAFGLSGAILTAVCYGLDSLWYALSPQTSLKFYSTISHNLNLSLLGGTPDTWQSFVIGLVTWVVSAYIGLWLFGWLYNKFAH